jgi:hypothetical protein
MIARSIKGEYDAMLAEHPRPHCWACGRDGSFKHKPPFWHAPWLVERSHLANKPRYEDRRAVVLLCSGCHKTSHGERIVGWTLPKLELPVLLLLKKMFDPTYWDREFVQRSSVRILPDLALRVPAVFAAEYVQRQGKLAAAARVC